MPSPYLEWGGSFQLTPNGGLQLASGWDEVRQRIVRRLLTNPQGETPGGDPVPADYIYDPTYGIGLRRRVGGLLGAREVSALQQQVLQGVMQDSGVATDRLPTVIARAVGQYSISILIGIVLATGERGQVTITLG